jgi:hypothetical protein
MSPSRRPPAGSLAGAHHAQATLTLLIRARARSRPSGFSLIEVMIAVLIITASIGALAVLSARQWASTKDLNVLDRVENAVALDLGFIKSHAKYWMMSSGPYNLCPENFSYTSTNSFTCEATADTPLSGAKSFTKSSTTITYDPDPNENTCPNPISSPVVADTTLATAFINHAKTSTIKPIWSFPPTGSGPPWADTLIDSATDTGRPSLPSGTKLERTISVGKNIVYVTYRFTGTNADPYGFVRKVAIHPEAAASCP